MARVVGQLKKPARIILIGAPGVGKGTQTGRLINRYPQLASLSSGDILRDHVRRKTPLGLEVEAAIRAGKLVPDSMMLELISQEFMTKGWISPKTGPTISSSFLPSRPSDPSLSSSSFILDGFPRTAAQAASLDGIIPMNFVVHLLTPPSVIISRIASRWVHAPSGRVYNTEFNPPKVPGRDDVTGEPLVQRQDDSVETWKERLRKFEETSRSLLGHYEKRGCLWRVEGNSSDEISPKLFKEIERRFF